MEGKRERGSEMEMDGRRERERGRAICAQVKNKVRETYEVKCTIHCT